MNGSNSLGKKKSALPIHIWNLLIILTVSFAAYNLIALDVVDQLNLFRQLVIILCITLPIYLFTNLALKKHKLTQQKDATNETGKVIVLQEYLETKNRAL